MNIFITGAKSFIGNELIKQIKSKTKHKVYGCDIVDDERRFIFKADIRNKNFYLKIPKKINTIIHLASISRDQECKKDLSECYKTNVIGTLNVINAAKKLKVKKLIFASTEWVYHDELAKVGCNEKSKLNLEKLNSDYAKTKLISEYNLEDFYVNQKIDVTILRFGIIYGDRFFHWSAVESLFNSVKNNKIINVGSLKTSRKFIHVNDVCLGIIKSLKLKNFSIINLQGKKLITLREIINLSKKILKKEIKVIEKDSKRPSIRNIKSVKSFKKISLTPKIDLENGLNRLKKFLNF